MIVTTRGIEVRYNDRLDLEALERYASERELRYTFRPREKLVIFEQKNPEERLGDKLDQVREIIGNMEGLEWQ